LKLIIKSIYRDQHRIVTNGIKTWNDVKVLALEKKTLFGQILRDRGRSDHDYKVWAVGCYCGRSGGKLEEIPALYSDNTI
jgi:hypothetical protein